MQKYLSLIICIFLFGELRAQGYQAELLLGANFSQIDGDQLAGYNKLGLNTGIAISRKVKEPWEWSFEILYTQKGSKKVIDPEVFTPTLKIDYHYAEVPILARYNFNKKIRFFAGPSVGISVFNERDDNGFIAKEEALLKYEVAFHLGGTYFFTDHWGAELRHSYSVLSIRDYPIVVNSPTWFGRAGWYNRLYTIGLRYNLGT
ncbi:MAG: PorT family protein [Bacteroidia bacterium]